MIVPLAGAGTSASTLSVETSTTVSPSLTDCPSSTCHSSTVPSLTDSPISGIDDSDRVPFAGPRRVSVARLAGLRGVRLGGVVAEVGVALAWPPGSSPGGVSRSPDRSALAPLPDGWPLGSISASA